MHSHTLRVCFTSVLGVKLSAIVSMLANGDASVLISTYRAENLPPGEEKPLRRK